MKCFQRKFSHKGYFISNKGYSIVQVAIDFSEGQSYSMNSNLDLVEIFTYIWLFEGSSTFTVVPRVQRPSGRKLLVEGFAPQPRE